MKIKNIRKIGKTEVYDISVRDVEHYVLENGVVTHNTGSYYSADNIWIIGRRQTKEGDDVIGYEFIINIEKSRFVKEKSQFPLTVTFEGGIDNCLSPVPSSIKLSIKFLSHSADNAIIGINPSRLVL